MRAEIEVAGRKRSYQLITRTSADTQSRQETSAVLIFLHGSKQTGQSVREFAGNSIDQLADNGHVAVVYPDGLQKRWNHNKNSSGSTNDVAFIESLADHFHGKYGPIPVIIAGFSNGGQLVIRLIHENQEKFHGAAIIGATLPRPGGLDFADQLRPLPVLLIHGTSDLVVPYGGEGWFATFFGARRGPSALKTAQYFAARNSISNPPLHEVLPHRKESGRTTVGLTRFEQDALPSVWLYTVRGGGHVVPNRHRKAIFLAGRTTQDITTAQALADFFPVLRK
ncbi:hypothetical protein AAFM46_13275 [Arthrobacter sp. TMP15]|uniref:alpha/beta hydrolase family esterase n=1 Tax=Arthrobacter sp. TMP15 TaxID=3140789 RepID=UPI0031BA33BD